ncbi:TIGR03618 family F420-dependent PPOX class oxidoreductase [Streptomyces sp. NPDC005181]|uniref:pyridoxamine 5'-phosphate oxidase family protein n=1 Tax=Streptomyces sp. NPDC005181 TaxID=3156869 RepID=UPI00339F8397
MKPLPGSVEAFLAEPLLATLTTIRPDGSPHVVPVRFTWDGAAGLARVMTMASSRKARNLVAAPGSRAVLCQAAGFRWITLEGTATVRADPLRVAEGVHRYTARYGSPPPEPPDRIVVEGASRSARPSSSRCPGRSSRKVAVRSSRR